MSEIESNRVDAGGDRQFVAHAWLIGSITFVSRILGMIREIVAAHFFGAGAVWSAFQYAFTIPNLFRKLLGEGALSASFIPLYAQSLKHASIDESRNFAVASVNLQASILLGLTILGEGVLLIIAWTIDLRPASLLAVKLTAIMLPYVMLVCGTAFLSGILQAHSRFAAAAATSIVSNLFMIVAIGSVAVLYDLRTDEGQERAVYWISIAVLLAGVAQLVMLVPSLYAVGFRFRLMAHFWTPAVRKMLVLSVPVALGAGVLQLGVLLDRQISFMLSQSEGATHFTLLGYTLAYPMEEGALARLNWAQFLYQFPLGVFAIALATAIFPKLSSDVNPQTLRSHRVEVPDEFKRVLRRGLEAAIFIGLPASIGMIVVRYPAVQLLFQSGRFTYSDAQWTALSTAIYSSAIWAFSIQQILNRAYYSIHDTRTPFIWAILNLVINLVVELPLVFTRLGESGMAVGTLVSFAVQSAVMLWLLNRRVGGIGLRESAPRIAKMLGASLVMLGACTALQYTPIYPEGQSKSIWAMQLALLIGTGAVTYFGMCAVLGINVLRQIRRARDNPIAADHRS
jgi:putative peptidoglycan lipid II flippase